MGAGLSSFEEKADASLSVEVQFKSTVNIEDVIKIAQDAGAAIMGIYNSEISKWEVNVKSDDSPLTKADLEANKVICEGLRSLSPHIPIITEEEASEPYYVRKNYQYCWMVDPLDGTKEFLKRNGQFTVNIALIQNNKPVVGIVYVPVTGKLYWAVQGKGAFLRDGDAPQRRLKCAEFGLEDPALKLVCSASHMSAETEQFVALFDKPEMVMIGSSLKLLMVAEGQADIYPRLAPTMEWDTAAADVIVREAGGTTVQSGLCDSKGKLLEDWKDALQKEEEVVYNKENLLNPFFVVFGKRRAGAN